MEMETRSRAIDKVYKRRDRIEMPDFQREEVWAVNKKRLLIDSILNGWHLPKFYFRKLDDGTLECVDGQQRLSSIFEFFNDELALSEDSAASFGGARYSQLQDDISDAFDDFEIEIEEIQEATEEELEELFKRLQLGTPLNTAEKLNAIMGDLRDFCHEMAEKPFFRSKIGLKNTRYAHFETIVRWTYVEARGIQPQMRLPQLESLLRDNKTFSRSSNTAVHIRDSLDFLAQAFPDACPFVRNRANALSACMLAGRVTAQGLASDLHAREFSSFIEDFFRELSEEVQRGVRALDRELLRYQHAITSGSTGGDSIAARINILTKRLTAHSPRFAPLLGAHHEAAAEAVRNVTELAGDVRDRVFAVNRKYAATHGEDLFKMTTESSAGLSTLAEPCRDINQYGKIIDALYFLVYEGSGACKRLPDPPPAFAIDIKLLRTSIRHDVDHGTKGEVRKKRLKASQVFEHLSGKKTPDECGPEEFLAVQVRIFRELQRFLRNLQLGLDHAL